jgi:hypothetical protein
VKYIRFLLWVKFVNVFYNLIVYYKSVMAKNCDDYGKPCESKIAVQTLISSMNKELQITTYLLIKKLWKLFI